MSTEEEGAKSSEASIEMNQLKTVVERPLSFVRFPLMSPHQLVRFVQSSSLVDAEVVIEALAYQADPTTKGALQYKDRSVPSTNDYSIEGQRITKDTPEKAKENESCTDDRSPVSTSTYNNDDDWKIANRFQSEDTRFMPRKANLPWALSGLEGFDNAPTTLFSLNPSYFNGAYQLVGSGKASAPSTILQHCSVEQTCFDTSSNGHSIAHTSNVEYSDKNTSKNDNAKNQKEITHDSLPSTSINSLSPASSNTSEDEKGPVENGIGIPRANCLESTATLSSSPSSNEKTQKDSVSAGARGVGSWSPFLRWATSQQQQTNRTVLANKGYIHFPFDASLTSQLHPQLVQQYQHLRSASSAQLMSILQNDGHSAQVNHNSDGTSIGYQHQKSDKSPRKSGDARTSQRDDPSLALPSTRTPASSATPPMASSSSTPSSTNTMAMHRVECVDGSKFLKFRDTLDPKFDKPFFIFDDTEHGPSSSRQQPSLHSRHFATMQPQLQMQLHQIQQQVQQHIQLQRRPLPSGPIVLQTPLSNSNKGKRRL